MTEPQGWQPSDEVAARVAVEQVDRDAYADEVERLGDKEYADRVRAGQCDTLSMLHMLARHRITAMQSGWQPIERAPENVRVLLAWEDWRDGKWMISTDYAVTGERWPNGYSSVSRHGSATHWQPLPAPPQRGGVGG